MCKQPMTLARALASIKTFGPASRAHLRSMLGVAPPPSMKDALQRVRTPDSSHTDRLKAGLSQGVSVPTAAPSTPRSAAPYSRSK
jgi:hypothetical protein